MGNLHIIGCRIVFFLLNATTTRSYEFSCGDSVADFRGWDDNEARLRCSDDVSGDMQEGEIPGAA